MKIPGSVFRDKKVTVIRHEVESYNDRKIPVLFIMTSNAPEEYYTPDGYGRMVENYRNTLSAFIGPAKVLISGNTLQVSDYDRYNWTMFDAEVKKERHETVFPLEMQKAYSLGAEMVGGNWGQDV